MVADIKLRAEQRRRLYQLLVIREFEDEMSSFIRQTQAEMDEEDIAYVEKQVAKFKADKMADKR